MSDAQDTAEPTTAEFLVKVAELGARAQNAVLLAEMEALAMMLPGVGGLTAPPATDAEVENGFDNMPV